MPALRETRALRRGEVAVRATTSSGDGKTTPRQRPGPQPGTKRSAGVPRPPTPPAPPQARRMAGTRQRGAMSIIRSRRATTQAAARQRGAERTAVGSRHRRGEREGRSRGNDRRSARPPGPCEPTLRPCSTTADQNRSIDGVSDAAIRGRRRIDARRVDGGTITRQDGRDRRPRASIGAEQFLGRRRDSLRRAAASRAGVLVVRLSRTSTSTPSAQQQHPGRPAESERERTSYACVEPQEQHEIASWRRRCPPGASSWRAGRGWLGTDGCACACRPRAWRPGRRVGGGRRWAHDPM